MVPEGVERRDVKERKMDPGHLLRKFRDDEVVDNGRDPFDPTRHPGNANSIIRDPFCFLALSDFALPPAPALWGLNPEINFTLSGMTEEGSD